VIKEIRNLTTLLPEPWIDGVKAFFLQSGMKRERNREQMPRVNIRPCA